jgi:hypothetical protein
MVKFIFIYFKKFRVRSQKKLAEHLLRPAEIKSVKVKGKPVTWEVINEDITNWKPDTTFDFTLAIADIPYAIGQYAWDLEEWADPDIFCGRLKKVFHGSMEINF